MLALDTDSFTPEYLTIKNTAPTQQYKKSKSFQLLFHNFAATFELYLIPDESRRNGLQHSAKPRRRKDNLNKTATQYNDSKYSIR